MALSTTGFGFGRRGFHGAVGGAVPPESAIGGRLKCSTGQLRQAFVVERTGEVHQAEASKL